MNMNFFTGIFQGFCLLFRNTYLKEHPWVAAFLGKYYSREYFYVKYHSQDYFKGSTYLLVNKYWGSSYFPVNNYWVVLSSGEYLLTVTQAPF